LHPERVIAGTLLMMCLTAAAPQSAVEAERAFAADAQTEGQWTAFRKWAAPEAVLFVPRPVNAHEWLNGKANPQLGYQWWPAKAFLSCDGKAAVTTGPSVIGLNRGYFTTVWTKQPDGAWRWVLDHGDASARTQPAGETTETVRASCRALPARLRDEGQPGPAIGTSPDRSLVWRWHAYENGARIIWAELWDGKQFRTVLENKVDSPAR
jgi:hypothetical protein